MQASIAANVFTIAGNGQEKGAPVLYISGNVAELSDLVPGILTQLGPESLASLRKLAESYQAAAGAGGADDDVPELVEDFEQVSTA